jgi:hypothetical protein
MKKPASARPAIEHNALQELYYYLDHANSDRYLAYYGQCRAQEMSHERAIVTTLTHFLLEHAEWFQRRLDRFEPTAEYSIAHSNVRPLDQIKAAA